MSVRPKRAGALTIEGHQQLLALASLQLDQLINVNLTEIATDADSVLKHNADIKDAFTHYEKAYSETRDHLKRLARTAEREQIRQDKLQKLKLVNEIKDDLNDYAQVSGFDHLSSVADNSSIRSGFSLSSQLNTNRDAANK